MGPYTKRNDSTVLDDGWTIADGDGGVIAHLDTEHLANCLLACLLGHNAVAPDDYPADEPLGEEAEADPEREPGDPLGPHCQHAEHEDCLNCRGCGRCSESLDEDEDLCDDCRQKANSGNNNRKSTLIVPLVDRCDPRQPTVGAEVRAVNGTLEIHLPGYGVQEMPIGFGCPLYLEQHKGKLRLCVWGDINNPNPTHEIDLSAARENQRKEVLEGPGDLSLELDRAEIVPEDPGQGTPALVVLNMRPGMKEFTGTYDCVLATGEIDGVALSQQQLTWLQQQGETVEDFLKPLPPIEGGTATNTELLVWEPPQAMKPDRFYLVRRKAGADAPSTIGSTLPARYFVGHRGSGGDEIYDASLGHGRSGFDAVDAVAELYG